VKKISTDSGAEEMEARDVSRYPDDGTVIEVLCFTLYAICTLMIGF